MLYITTLSIKLRAHIYQKNRSCIKVEPLVCSCIDSLRAFKCKLNSSYQRSWLGLIIYFDNYNSERNGDLNPYSGEQAMLLNYKTLDFSLA